MVRLKAGHLFNRRSGQGTSEGWIQAVVGLDKVRLRAGQLGSRRSGQGTSEGRTLRQS